MSSLGRFLLELFAAPFPPPPPAAKLGSVIQDLTLGFEPKLSQEFRADLKVSVNKNSAE